MVQALDLLLLALLPLATLWVQPLLPVPLCRLAPQLLLVLVLLLARLWAQLLLPVRLC